MYDPNLSADLQKIELALSHQKRQRVSDLRVQLGVGLISLGNAALSALFFSQILTDRPFNAFFATFSFFLFSILYFIAIILMKGE